MDNYFKVPFANAGDKTAIPEDTQANGSVSYTTGYGLDYQKQRGVDSDAKAIERDKMNSLLFKTTAAIQAMQTFGGASAFITAADNGGTAYSYNKGARVSLSGVVYESLTNSNATTPPGANWQVVNWGDVVSFLDSRFVNASGDTMAGDLGFPIDGATGAKFGADTGLVSPEPGQLVMKAAGAAVALFKQVAGDGTFGNQHLRVGAGAISGSAGIGFNGATQGSLILQSNRYRFLDAVAAPVLLEVKTPDQSENNTLAATTAYVRQYASGAANDIKVGPARIQTGTVTVTDIPAGGAFSQNVTFPEPYAVAPVVLVSWAGAPGQGAENINTYVKAGFISNVGFAAAAVEPSGATVAQSGVISWVAIGV